MFGCHEEYLACKKMSNVVLPWLSMLSLMKIMLPFYGRGCNAVLQSIRSSVSVTFSRWLHDMPTSNFYLPWHFILPHDTLFVYGLVWSG